MTPWWKGARGEWFVVAQVVLVALVFFGPRTLPGLPAFPIPRVCSAAGIVLMVLGAALLLAGLIRLGPNLTPLPYPRDRATLIETGAYRWVRHPMYAGGILAAFGWALVVHGGLTLGYATLLLIFADIKSRREERWLRERFAGYAAYARRVKKLVPFVY